jgi:isopentenyl diphosphate isomerase/L-lactate dehydrogenase-like FMN-dependent dehydrogenase
MNAGALDDWPLNLVELEARAAELLEPTAYDYFRSGAGDELTLARNRAAFAELQLLPHVLRDVAEISLETEVLGTRASLPVVVAPTAFHGLAHDEAELASARGAAAADAVFCLSTLSNTTLEAIAEAAKGPRWFQLYVFKDRGLTRELVSRAEAAGFGAIVLTVDAPVLGRRERDVRNGFALPDHLSIACVGDAIVAPDDDSGLAAYFASQLDPSLTWSDLQWLVDSSGLPVLVKGVHRADDAERAVECGAAGVIVSNHGARQLDTVPATIEMLPAVAGAVGEDAAVLLDGGVRRGTDVVKALCLGADAVLIGRPIIWGLALDGEAGVRRAINMLRIELREALALCGCSSLDELSAELISPAG